MGSRTWVKVHCNKWIEGSIREETTLVRCVFIDLIALAGAGEYGDSGVISLKNGIGMTDLQFQKILKLSKTEWQTAKKRLIYTERISVNQDNIITIINWKKYQSEYERQKPYRNKKLQPEVTTESYTGEREGDNRDRERDDISVNISFLEEELQKPELLPWQRQKIKKELTELRRKDPDKYVKGKYGHMVRR